MLGFSPKDKEVFFNVRRDNLVGPRTEIESQWSQGVVASQGAHNFGTLIFNEEPGKLSRDEFWLNRAPRYWYITGRIEPIAKKKGEYAGAKQMYSKLPGWDKAEEAAEKMAAFMKKHPQTISDEIDDLYMEWQQKVRTLQTTAPKQEFRIACRNAAVTSVSLNGYAVAPKDGVYQLSMYTGINALKISAQAKGKNPGIRLELKGSPETAATVSASVPGSEKASPVQEKDGYIWLGDAEKLDFTQNLIWNREYCNHPLQFITPNVKEWGVSPMETMFFIHRMFNPEQTGECSYKLILEAPEGFVRVNDISYARVYPHYWTRDVKTEKIVLNGKKYMRYTYLWNLPKKLTYNQKYYTHFISFRNEYKFKPGETVDFRFRRVVNDNTTDIVNVIKVVPLPEIKGGKLTKVLFPQYHHFMDGRVSHEQWKAMADQSCKAGLNSFMVGAGILSRKNTAEGKETKFKNSVMNQKGTCNFLWANCSLPLWGSHEGHVRTLIEKTPDLQVRYYKNTGSATKNFYREFCLTNATGKYRKEFMEAMRKDYQDMLNEVPSCKYIFLNDENFPNLHGQWRHAVCFCDVCKEDFRKMFKIPASEKLTDELIVTKYEAQWGLWWRHKHKGQLLQMAFETIHQLGAKLFYYHQSHDTRSYAEAKGKYDMVSIPLPGCASFCGNAKQAEMDAAKAAGEKTTGLRQSIGQFVTYTRSGAFFSSDSFHFYPKEVKMVLIRAAATNHNGALCECASLFSAGALYYAGQATQIIAAYEDLFYNGVRADKLAVSDTFKYPAMLVLKKGSERLVLIFNEDHEKPRTGVVRNLELKPGQTAKIWGSGKVIKDASRIQVTVPPQDVAVICIK